MDNVASASSSNIHSDTTWLNGSAIDGSSTIVGDTSFIGDSSFYGNSYVWNTAPAKCAQHRLGDDVDYEDDLVAGPCVSCGDWIAVHLPAGGGAVERLKRLVADGMESKSFAMEELANVLARLQVEQDAITAAMGLAEVAKQMVLSMPADPKPKKQPRRLRPASTAPKPPAAGHDAYANAFRTYNSLLVQKQNSTNTILNLTSTC